MPLDKSVLSRPSGGVSRFLAGFYTSNISLLLSYVLARQYYIDHGQLKFGRLLGPHELYAWVLYLTCKFLWRTFFFILFGHHNWWYIYSQEQQAWGMFAIAMIVKVNQNSSNTYSHSMLYGVIANFFCQIWKCEWGDQVVLRLLRSAVCQVAIHWRVPFNNVLIWKGAGHKPMFAWALMCAFCCEPGNHALSGVAHANWEYCVIVEAQRLTRVCALRRLSLHSWPICLMFGFSHAMSYSTYVSFVRAHGFFFKYELSLAWEHW